MADDIIEKLSNFHIYLINLFKYKLFKNLKNLYEKGKL